MSKIFSAVLFALGAIQLLWSYFSATPIIPSVSLWLQSKGYSVINANLVLGLVFILLGLLVLRFSKKKSAALKIDSIVCEKVVGFKCACRVKILNESLTIPAKGLKVELVKIDPVPKWKEAPTENLPLAFPIRLRAKEKDGDNINPKDSSLFELFMVSEGGWTLEVEFMTDAMWKTFEYNFFQAHFCDEASERRPVSEYHLTIAASADYCPRIETFFKMTIIDDTEREIIFSAYE
jgi:hypothetical protein